MLKIIGDKQLYQWDTDRTANVTVDCDEVHFSNLKFGKALIVDVVDGVVEIPDELLQSGETIYAWAFVRTESGGHTKLEQSLSVERRARPAGYVYEPTEILNYSALAKALEQEIENRRDNDALVLKECEKAIKAVQEQTVEVVANERNERANKDAELQEQIDELKPKYSDGLEFQLNADGISYTVARGECLDNNIVLPAYYEGLPVTNIGKFSLATFDAHLESVTIPATVTSIEEGAFVGPITYGKYIILADTPPMLPSINAINMYKSEGIFVLYRAVSAYNDAPYWKDFAMLGYIHHIDTPETLRKSINEETTERAAADKNLQNNINKEVNDRIKAQTSLQNQINSTNDKVGVVGSLATADFVAINVSITTNNYIDVHLLMAHGANFEVRSASWFYWGSDALNATISDGISFSIPAVISGNTITIKMSQISILNGGYAYAGVGRIFVRNITT